MISPVNAIKKFFGLTKSFPSVSSFTNYDTIYSNHFKRFHIPQDDRLVELYRRNIYSCANINSNGCTRVPLRLYVKTGRTDTKTKLVTKSLNSLQKGKLLKSSPTLRSAIDVEEVLEHPALDLLRTVNDSPHINSYLLFRWTFLYLDICGACYWLIKDGPFGTPNEIWLLPTHYVDPIREPESKKIVDYYKVNNREASTEEKYPPEMIMPFLNPDLTDPYVRGLGALGASYEDNTLANQLVAHQQGYLENEARPDLIISPKDSEGSMGADMAKRYEKELALKFGKGRGGGLHVSPEPITLNEVGTPPRDMARLEIPDKAKEQIANAFDVPISLLQNKTVNKATLEAALTQHALMGVDPRLQNAQSVLNSNFLSRWDDSGRLFFKYDNPVPEDRELKMQENVQLKQVGIITGNEARDNYDYPPHPDGDKLESINAAADVERQKKRDSGEAEQ